MKEWTKEKISELLASNDVMVGRSLVRLWKRQTPDEQDTMTAKNQNAKGFNAFDANFLSSLAKFYETNGWLTNKQMELARKKLKKYTGQLVLIANNG